MKTSNEVQLCYYTLGELVNLVKFHSANRNHFFDVNEAIENGYVGIDAESGKKRIKKTIKDIFKKGEEKWSITSPLIMSKDFVVIEGQGRIEAQKYMLNNKNYPFVTENDEIPCLVYDKNSDELDICKAIKEMNTNKKNWTIRDFIHFEIAKGNVFVAKMLEETLEWMKRLNTLSPNNVFVFMLSSKSVNHLDEAVADIENGKINEYRYEMLNTYLNCISKAPEKMRKKLVCSQGAYQMRGLIGSILRYCQEHNLDEKKYFSMLEKYFGKAFNKYKDEDFNAWFRGGLGNKQFIYVLHSSVKDSELNAMLTNYLNPCNYTVRKSA